MAAMAPGRAALADFNNDRPESIEAPEWARRW
jgi:hypothetical protein